MGSSSFFKIIHEMVSKFSIGFKIATGKGVQPEEYI